MQDGVPILFRKYHHNVCRIRPSISSICTTGLKIMTSIIEISPTFYLHLKTIRLTMCEFVLNDELYS